MPPHKSFAMWDLYFCEFMTNNLAAVLIVNSQRISHPYCFLFWSFRIIGKVKSWQNFYKDLASPRIQDDPNTSIWMGDLFSLWIHDRYRCQIISHEKFCQDLALPIIPNKRSYGLEIYILCGFTTPTAARLLVMSSQRI